MRHQKIIFAAASLVLPMIAGAWGSYGHQQVNRAAVLLIEDTQLGKCLQKNMDLMQRLAISPDFDWKSVGTKPPTPELIHDRAVANAHEHPHHYFEADAFIQGTVTPAEIQALPHGPFADAYNGSDGKQGLVALFVENLSKIRAVNPDKLKDETPIKHIEDPEHPKATEIAGANGSAPWRSLQLYQLAVQALEDGQTDMALMYMGTMGHYIGDMSQPFHASLNYDGDYYLDKSQGTWRFFGKDGPFSPASGIHASFEETMLELAYEEKIKGNPAVMGPINAMLAQYCKDQPHPAQCMSEKRFKQNPMTELWPNFTATESDVVGFANKSEAHQPVAAEDLVQQVLNLVSSGYNYIVPLLDKFALATAKVSVVRPHKEDKPSGAPAEQAKEQPTEKLDRAPKGIRKGKKGDVGMAAVRAKPSVPVTEELSTESLANTTSSGEQAPGRSIPKGLGGPVDAFKEMTIGTDKVLTIAEKRMAASSTLLAQLWLGIYQQAKAEKGSIPSIENCEKLDVADLSSNYLKFLTLVIGHYPPPTYLTSSREPQSTPKKKEKKDRQHAERR